MKWICVGCQKRLSGKEKYCPECGQRMVYRCQNCEKELDDGRHKYCTLCKMEMNERRMSKAKAVGAALLGVLAVAGGVAANKDKIDDMINGDEDYSEDDDE